MNLCAVERMIAIVVVVGVAAAAAGYYLMTASRFVVLYR